MIHKIISIVLIMVGAEFIAIWAYQNGYGVSVGLTIFSLSALSFFYSWSGFKITKQFEPQSLIDWFLIPYWAARYLITCIVYKSALIEPGYGRRTSLEPYCCERCLWSGPVRWLVHSYQDDGSGEDVEPVDECPRCGLGF